MRYYSFPKKKKKDLYNHSRSKFDKKRQIAYMAQLS